MPPATVKFAYLVLPFDEISLLCCEISEKNGWIMRQNSFENQINLNVRGLPVSATLAINEKSAELRRQGKKIYRLGLGQSPFPVPDPVVEVLRARAHFLPFSGTVGFMCRHKYHISTLITDYVS